MPQGILLLKQSLEIALKNSYHEHAARAYAALGSNARTVDHHISSILLKLDVNSRIKAVSKAVGQAIIK